MTTIERIDVIRTAPAGIRLVAVKVQTSEPGLYGVGCASMTFRDEAIEKTLEQLAPLLIGRDVRRIEEIWNMASTDAYWRNGPIGNNALSGVDMALWDILGKLAGMPVYQLFGGKSREAAVIYQHAYGDSPEALADDVQRLRSLGVRYVRLPIDPGVPGGGFHTPRGAIQDAEYHDPVAAVRRTVRNLEVIRDRLGADVGLLYDVHERLQPAQAIQLAKEVERFDLFFLEDPLAPEHNEWFRQLRAHTSTPLAMGELFVNPNEWIPLVKHNLIDYIRCHISAIGGLTPARKLAAFCELHGVRTAWHGPRDVSPIGHAANLHLDVSVPNFGIQELAGFTDAEREVFPGTPEVEDGYLYPNDRPGLGIDVDERAAKRYPPEAATKVWPVMRRPDGSVMKQ
jgi:mannonate dehydratase